MKIKSVFIFGTFSFPTGQAASARLREIALGFLDHVDSVKVICPFSDSVEAGWSTYRYEDKQIEYYSTSASRYTGSNKVERLKSRYSQISKLNELLEVLESNLSNNGSEAVFLYGRSYHYLNGFLNRKASSKWEVRTIIDIVEPPHTSKKFWSFIKHPFSIDSLKSFNKSILTRIDLGVFISNQLKEDYSQYFKESVLVPSVTYTSTAYNEMEEDVEILRCGYLGSMIRKDHPELLFKFFSELLKRGVAFELSIFGRSSFFEEGRKWRQVFENSGFSDRISFFDNPSDQELNQALKTLNALVIFRYPDPIQLRTFPTRIVEFLKTHKTLILNRYGDLSIYFAHAKNCFEIDEKLDFSTSQFQKLMIGKHRSQLASNAAQLLNTSFSASYQAGKILKKL